MNRDELIELAKSYQHPDLNRNDATTLARAFLEADAERKRLEGEMRRQVLAAECSEREAYLHRINALTTERDEAHARAVRAAATYLTGDPTELEKTRAERDAARAEVSSLRSETERLKEAEERVWQANENAFRRMKEAQNRQAAISAERNALKAELSALRAEIEKAPVVYSSIEGNNDPEAGPVSGSVTDTWRTDYHDVSNAVYRARLVRIEPLPPKK